MEKNNNFFTFVSCNNFSGFFGKKLEIKTSQIITSLFVSISALLSIYIFYEVIVNGYSNNIIIAKWISSGFLDVNWSIKIDQLSSVMLVVVTLVSAIVHAYSIGYMSHDPSPAKIYVLFISVYVCYACISDLR